MKEQTLSANRKLSRSGRTLKNETLSPDSTFDRLQQIVRRHDVVWDIWPEYHIDREGKSIQIGFEFTVIGAHRHPERIVEPGCPQCLKIYKDLQQIIHWIIPKERRDGFYEIVIADALPHYSSQQRFKPDVRQVVRIIHREGCDHSVNACEVGCLMEMKGRAEKLGIVNIGARPAG